MGRDTSGSSGSLVSNLPGGCWTIGISQTQSLAMLMRVEGCGTPASAGARDNSWDPMGAAGWADHRFADLPTLMKMWCSTCYPVPSMGLVYLPTFTINKSNTCRHIYHTWILWVMECFWSLWICLFGCFFLSYAHDIIDEFPLMVPQLQSCFSPGFNILNVFGVVLQPCWW